MVTSGAIGFLGLEGVAEGFNFARLARKRQSEIKSSEV
jgi:hypothetical protein